MKKFWLALLVFLFWSILMFLFHQFFGNKLLGSAHEQPDINQQEHKALKTSDRAESTAFVIRADDGTIRYKFDDVISINRLNGELNIPDELLSFKDSIYDYLNAHQDKEVLIRVKFLASEVDSINKIHFGKERVQHLKNLLTSSGINPDKLYFETLASNYNYDEQGLFSDGISMTFQAISDEHNQQIEAGIRNKTLYADFAQAEFKPDRTLMAYTIELKNYLANASGRTIIVTGHTDSVGVNNDQWGLDRANNVKKYLVAQGIPSAIIKVVSRGETQPIASNLTEEGRAKNRRIVITVK